MSLEDELSADARLYAIEWMISMLFALNFAQVGSDGPAMLEEATRNALESARRQTFPNLDPAMSDLTSAEREAAIQRLLGLVKEMLAAQPDKT